MDSPDIIFLTKDKPGICRHSSPFNSRSHNVRTQAFSFNCRKTFRISFRKHGHRHHLQSSSRKFQQDGELHAHNQILIYEVMFMGAIAARKQFLSHWCLLLVIFSIKIDSKWRICFIGRLLAGELCFERVSCVSEVKFKFKEIFYCQLE